MRVTRGKKKLCLSLIIPTLIGLFNVFLVLYPKEVIYAACEGVGLWYSQVLPSLLPFMIGINILNGLGFACFLGALFSPLMRPLFNLPGAGGFVLLSGMTSGYPMGAKMNAQLRAEGRFTKNEAQRLMGFCNNAGPLFIIGVAGTGLFGNVNAGYCLWASHILAAITVGLILRKTPEQKNTLTDSALQALRPRGPNRLVTPLRRAFIDYRHFRANNNCDFGYVLSESVKNAMDSITLIGGFIILFCVVIRVFFILGIISASRSGASETLINGLLAGGLEVTNGVKILSAGGMSRAPLAAAAAVISFGGFSIHAQTMYFLRKTDIKTGPYLAAKALNAALAAGYCLFLYPLFL